jgi:hypothetical protein
MILRGAASHKTAIFNTENVQAPDNKKKVKQSRYTPWRHMGGEEV